MSIAVETACMSAWVMSGRKSSVNTSLRQWTCTVSRTWLVQSRCDDGAEGVRIDCDADESLDRCFTEGRDVLTSIATVGNKEGLRFGSADQNWAQLHVHVAPPGNVLRKLHGRNCQSRPSLHALCYIDCYLVFEKLRACLRDEACHCPYAVLAPLHRVVDCQTE